MTPKKSETNQRKRENGGPEKGSPEMRNPERLTTEATINGARRLLEHEPGDSLLTALRAHGVVGPKRSCEAGDCGCCTVWLDERAVQSCILPAWRAEGQRITTIEGLSSAVSPEETPAVTDPDRLHRMQAAFLREEGYQCGYCTAGMIMTLGSEETEETEGCCGSEAPSLRDRTKGNICRCTGWKSIERSYFSAATASAVTAPLAPTETAAGVGGTVANRHGPDIVTGEPSFTSDFLPRMPANTAYVAAIRSPHPHARVLSVDDRNARKLPGVIDVIWHEHVPRIPYTTACHPAEPRDAFDTYLLDDRVRFVGQRVAIVVAESIQIARRAAALVRVEYEPLPAVFDPREATEPGAPVIHPEPESTQIGDRERNIIGEIGYTQGHPAEVAADAAATVEITVRTPRQQHTHMEPHAATAWVEADGTLVVRASTQVPYLARRTLARILSRPEASIRVFKPRVGGGFGNKQEVLCEDIVAFAALRLGRPVHWEFNRHEEFTATNSRHPMELTVRAGANREGRLTSLELDFLSNGGAYGNHSYDVLECGAFESLALYRCANKRTRGRAVYTNTLPAGAFRGYGAAQTTFAVDCALDELARKLEMDPLEFRARNLVTAEDTLHIEDAEDEDHQLGSYALDRCVDYVRERIAEIEKIEGHPAAADTAHTADTAPAAGAANAAAPTTGDPSAEATDRWLYGRGYAVSTIGSGLASIHTSGAVMELTRRGFSLSTSTADIGTASDTTLAQIAAEALSLPYDLITVATGDTAAAPEDSGAYASATIYIAGKAVQLAAERLKERILAVAADTLGRTPEELAPAPAGIVTAGASAEAGAAWAAPGAAQATEGADNGRAGSRHAATPPAPPLLSWAALIDAAEAAGVELRATVERFSHDRVSMSFAAVGIRLRVHRLTGRVEILNLVQGVDAGRLINPRVALGQAEGATVQSLGLALSEELRIDSEGRVANPSFRDYRVPSIGEVGEIETRFFESEDSDGPFGAKALGELTTTAVPAAVANAVSDAIGVRMTELPVTPERCLKAVKESESMGAHRRWKY